MSELCKQLHTFLAYKITLISMLLICHINKLLNVLLWQKGIV